MPRLNGSRRTRAPRTRAARVVPSVEPSSTTTTSSPGSNARISSMTLAIASSSLSAGTIATRRSSRSLGSAAGGAAVATGPVAAGFTRLSVASEDDTRPSPPARDERIRGGNGRRQIEHPRVEHGGQKRRERPVGRAPERLRRAASPPEPRAVAREPPPAGCLLAQPALPEGQQGDADLDREQDRCEQQQRAARIRGQE